MEYILLTLFFFIIMLVYFRIADRFNIIDKPNERSSHTSLTIGGGGILFLIAIIVSGVMYPHYWLPVFGATIIGIISFLDDRITLSSRIRIVFHLAAVSILFYFLPIFGVLPVLAVVALYILVIGIINAYNFMDGIKGKRLFIIRPCMIHGPGNKGNLNLLYNVVKKGIPYPLGAFENRRSLLSIDNLVFALDKIINDINIPGGVYNLADDRPMSTNEMVNVIAEGSGLKTRIYRINKGLVTAIARAGDIVGLPLNSERLKKLTETYVVSNEKIKKVLNIDHFPVSSREGLFKTIKSFQKI